MKNHLEYKDEHRPLPGENRHHGFLVCQPNKSHMDRVIKIAAGCDELKPLKLFPFHGGMKSKGLKLANFENPQRLHVILVMDMLREGYDYAPISVVAFASKVHSAVKLYQAFGRGLRRAPGEKELDDDDTKRVGCDVLLHRSLDLQPLYECCIGEKLVPHDVADAAEDRDEVGEKEE